MKSSFDCSQPWRITKRVLPQHADHAGVMWHGSYALWLEEARIEILSMAGLDYYDLTSVGIEMPVVSMKINYKDALFHGEQIVLENWFSDMKGVKLICKTNFLKSGNILAAEALIELVLVNKLQEGFKIIRNPPEFIKNALDKIKLGPDKKKFNL